MHVPLDISLEPQCAVFHRYRAIRAAARGETALTRQTTLPTLSATKSAPSVSINSTAH